MTKQENDKLLSGRLTSAKMVAWLNAEFERLEINQFVVTSIVRSNFPSYVYEGGACRLYVHFKDKDETHTGYTSKGTFLCFYSIAEYQDYLRSGYEMYLKFRDGRFYLLNDMEIEVRKNRACNTL